MSWVMDSDRPIPLYDVAFRAISVSVFRAAGFSPRGLSQLDVLCMPVCPAHESENRSRTPKVDGDQLRRLTNRAAGPPTISL